MEDRENLCRVRMWYGYSTYPCGRPLKKDPNTGEYLPKCGVHLGVDKRAFALKKKKEAEREEARATAAFRREDQKPLEAALKESGVGHFFHGLDYNVDGGHRVTFYADQFPALLDIINDGLAYRRIGHG